MKGRNTGEARFIGAAIRALLCLALAAPMLTADRANAQSFECSTEREDKLMCRKLQSTSVVCDATQDSGTIDISRVAACVGNHFDAGPNPIVTLAASGGGSEPTDRYSEWNGGTAFTTHKLSALEDELDGQRLHYEVAYRLLDSTDDFIYPGQATFVSTERIRSTADIERLDGRNTLLVAGGGGAHGLVIPGDAVEDAKRGGLGGYADGWSGFPCPYTADGVCADGTDGGDAKDAHGGAGGTEERSPLFVDAIENGVEDSFGDRFAWGGHGGAGHANGGGGSAQERLNYMSAGGGGGGASFAWRSTRETPGTVESRLLEQSGFQVFFHRDGLQSRFEWQYSDFGGGSFEPIEMKALDGSTGISATFNDPGAPETDVELAGLVLVTGCEQSALRLKPYRVTHVKNLGSTFTTTDAAELHYRLYDGDGNLVRTGQTNVAASFTPNKALDLVFRYTDEQGNRGRLSIFADSGEQGGAEPHRICRSR